MSAAGLAITEGGIDDLGAVMAVMGDSFAPCYGEAWTGPQCASLLSLPGVWLSVARLDGDPVGFSMARIVADEAELLLLAVRSGMQRRGIGAALLDRFMLIAKERKASRLHLEVRDGNHAINLYQHAGFTVVGRRRDYYRGGKGEAYDALTLALGQDGD